MKYLSILVLLLAGAMLPQNQSLSLPERIPVHCSKQADNCIYAGAIPGRTGVVVARQAAGGTVTDALGNIWTLDQCVPFDNGDCIFHTVFGPNPNNYADKLTFSGNNFYVVWLFVYDGIWNFSGGTHADYASDVAPPDCPAVGSCAYSWSRLVTADAGSLLIFASNSNATGQSIASPGFGWNVEASDGVFAVADMIAPVDSVYSGCIIWKGPNGLIGNGSHWLGVIAVYSRAK